MNYNERDIEHPAIIDFVKSHKDIETMLDVGAAYSYFTYANELRELLGIYDGIDILPDEKTAAILDNYFVGDVKDMTGGSYDLVACISTIEHSGISSYKSKDFVKERMQVFKKIVLLSKKYVFITFPYGLASFEDNEFANVTPGHLADFTKMCKSVKTTFYFSEAPQQQIPFRKVEKVFADEVMYIKELGTRCVCIMECLV